MQRRFPPPWSVEELGVCFVVREALGKYPGIFHFICLALSPNHLFLACLCRATGAAYFVCVLALFKSGNVRGTMTEAAIESDGIDVFVVHNGTRIAKRADPNTPQAGTWVPLKPGYRVFDKDYPAKLIVECDDKSSAVSSPG